ncbi:alpha/beta fold hydrolase [Leptolyngbya sp. FACHB-261]|uniref:alpha/beta fold hydrolase n=1 Tax=Leptolyngbya sp. FACHB-261 TaxID=2692806 RepID=UPI0018EFC19A|nr:alpha/beta fold hydrolase [Leptolyngbya sp. FACHB-261]
MTEVESESKAQLSQNPLSQLSVKHRTIKVDGTEIFYREAGSSDAPVLLPHGYPCSSFQFRNLMPALADRWRLIAPDYPG